MKRIQLLVGTMLALAGVSHGVDGTWNVDGSTNWGAGPWVGGVPNGIGEVAAFTNNITAARNVTNETTRTVGTILLGDNAGNNGGFSIVGSALTLDVAAGNALIAKLYGTSAETIGTALVLNDDLTVTNAIASNGASVSFTGAVSGAKSILLAGSGATDSGAFAFSGNNTYSGGTTIRVARANLTHGNAMGTGSIYIENGGQIFVSSAIVVTNPIFMTGNGWAETAGSLGAIRLSANGTVAGPITLTGDSRITAYGANDAGTIAGSIGGAYNLEKSGSGIIYLTGNNAYNATLISGGTVQVGRATASGSLGYGPVTNNAMLRFLRTDDLVVSNNVIGSGTLQQLEGSGTVVLLGSNSMTGLFVAGGRKDTAFVLGTGSTNLVTGNVQLGYNSGGLSRYGRLVISDGSTLRINGNLMLGEQSTCTGDVYQAGGDVSIGGQFRIGHWGGNYSTYTMDGGTFTMTGVPTSNVFTVGTFEQNGVIYLGIDGSGSFRQNGGNVSAAAVVLDNRGSTAETDVYTLAGGNLFLGGWGVQGNQSTRFDAGGGSLISSSNLVVNVPFHLTNLTGVTTISVPAAGFVTLSNAYGQGSAIVTNGTLVLANTAAGRNVLGGDLTLIGGGDIRQIGSGTTFLGGKNTANGVVVSNGTLGFALDASVGGAAAPITVAGGLLQVDGTTVRGLETHTINWSTFNGGIDVASPFNMLVITTNIDGTGSFTKAGPGRLVLMSADHTYSGGTIVSNGWLRLAGGNDALDTAGNIALVRGTLDLAGNTQATSGDVRFLNGVAQDGAITKSGTDYDVQAGLIGLDLGGAVNVVKSGPGMATLLGSNTFSGGNVTLNSGILSIVQDANLGAAGNAIVFGGGGALRIAGSAMSSLGGRTVNYSATATNAFDIAMAQNTFTVGDLIGGSSTFGKLGAGTLVLTAANNYSGATLIGNGTLRLDVDQATTGPTIIGTPATLQIGNGGAAGMVGTGDINNSGTVILKRSDTVVLPNVIAGNGSFQQAGSGTVIIGTNLTVNSFFTKQGTTVITNNGVVQANGWVSLAQVAGDNAQTIVNGTGILRSAGDFNVADLTGTRGSLYITDSAVVTGRTLYVGKGGNAVGTLFMDNGSLTIGGANESRIGGGGAADAAAYGYVRLSGGVMTIGTSFQPGSYGIGAVDITGGVLSNLSWNTPGRFVGSFGLVNFSGGIGYQYNVGAGYIVGEQGTAELNIENATILATGRLRIGGNATGTGTVNLATGGLMAVQNVETTGGQSFLNLHGGTLRLQQTGPTNFQGLTRATVWSEGGAMEVSNNIIANVRQNIEAPVGNGLASIAIADAGSGYVGTPVIRITGGGGTGATAVAEVDLVSGTVTNIRITNPGVGYLGTPAIQIMGGGASSGAYAGTVTLGVVDGTGGALAKTGAGMLSLLGTNTYTGGTDINGGLLAFGAPVPLTTNAFGGLTNGVFASFIAAVPTTGDIRINAGGGLLATGAYSSATAWLASGRIATNSAGSLVLTPALTAENIDLSTLGGGNYTSLFIGASPGTNILYTGTLTPAVGGNYLLGGGGGTLIMANNLALTGPGSLTVGNFTGSNTVVWLGGSNTYAGGTTVNGGILSLANQDNVGTSTRLDILAGGVQVRGGTLANFSTFTGSQTNFAGNFSYDIANLGNVFTENRDVTATGALLKLGQGTLALGGSNSFAGAVTVANGVLRLTNGDALSGAPSIAVNGILYAGINSNRSAVLQLSGGITVTNALTLQGLGWNNDGALRSLGAGNTYAGPITFLPGQQSRIQSDAGVFTLSGPITNNAGGLISILGGAGDYLVSGVVTGAGALGKDGGGTATLTAANQYTGGTYVYGGTLSLDFSAPGAPVTNIINQASGTVNLNGGTLRAISAATGANTQTFNSVVNVLPGNSAIVASNTPGGSVAVNLNGAIARGTGAGVLDIAGNGSVRMFSATNIAGLHGSHLTVNGSDFAAMDATSNIVAFAGYNTLAGATPAMPNQTNTVVRIDSSSTGNITVGSNSNTIHSLLVNDATARTITFGAGGLLRLSGASTTSGALLLSPTSGGLTIGSVPNEGLLTTFGATNSAAELILINNSANNLTINSAIINNGSGAVPVTIAGTGSGQVNLSGTNLMGGRLYVNSGTVNLNGAATYGGFTSYGGTVNVAAATTLNGSLVPDGTSVLNINAPVTVTGGNTMNVGQTVNSRTVVNVNSDVIITNGGRLMLASGNDLAAVVNQTAGNFLSSGNTVIGDGYRSWGGYRISGGTLATTLGQEMNIGYRVTGVMDILGGSVLVSNNNFSISRGDSGQASIGIVTVNGGLLGLGVTNGNLLMNYNANARSYAQLSVLNGAVDLYNFWGTRYLDVMANAGNTGIVSLVGGSVTANMVRANGTGLSVVNLDGGSLVMPANSVYGARFMTNLSAVYVYDGGAILDIGTNATVWQDFSGVFGYGLTNIPVANGGAGYIGNPSVRILGGSGTGATAVAQVDLATGLLTNILITSAGSGYLPDDVLNVQVFGGGYTTAATLGAYQFGPNANTGGLIKLGAAPLTMMGTSSYGGLTTVSNGTLIFANAAGTNLLTGGINGPGTLEHVGTGMTIVGGNGAGMSGAVNVSNGVVQFAAPPAMPPAANSVNIGPFGTVAIDGAGIQAVLTSGQVSPLSAGALALTPNSANENIDFLTPGMSALSLGAVGTVTYGGTLIPDVSGYRLGGGGGTLIYTNAMVGAPLTIGLDGGLPILGVSKVQVPNASSSVNVTIRTQGVLEVTSAGATIGTLSGGTGLLGWTNAMVNGALTVGNAGNATFVGGMSGTGSLTKMGAGTQVLSGNMTYTGLTTVGQGTLALVGTNAQLGGAAFVSNGAVLMAGSAGGYGLIGGYFTNLGINVSSSASLSSLFTNLSARAPEYGWLPTSVINNGGNLDFGNGGPTYPITGARTNNAQNLYVGRFIAPTNGTYWFDTASDDGSMLWVDGIMVASNNFAQGVTMRGGFIDLAAGVHDIVVTWWQGTGGMGFYSDVVVPGSTTTNRISNTMLAWGPTVGDLNGEIGSMVALSNGTLTVGQTAPGTFAGTVTGDVSSVFSKAGPAALTLSGTNNNFAGTMSVVNGALKFAAIDAVPANGTVNASTNGAMAFDFTGVQAALARVAPATTGTVALTAASAGDNLDFNAAALPNAFLGALGAQDYTGTLTPFGGASGTNRLTGLFGTLNMVNPITQGSVLIGNGAGLVMLTNANTYTGRTIFQAGTLQINADSGLGAVPGVATTNVVFDGNTGTLLAGSNNIALNANRAILVNSGRTGTVDTAANNLTINGMIDGINGTFVKTGSGNLTLGSTTNSITTLVIAEGGFSNSVPVGLLSNMVIGAMGDRAIARVATNLMVSGRMYIGTGVGSAGAVVQYGGTTTVGAALSGADVLSLGNNGGYGYYRLEGGILNVGQLAMGGNSAGANIGVFEQFGGITTVTNGSGWLLAGWGGSNGVLNVWNGTVFAPPGGNDVNMGFTANYNAYGMFNVLGAGAVLNTITGSTTRAVDLLRSAGNVAGFVNVNDGGLLIANQIKKTSTGTGVLSIDGGTIQANGGQTQAAFLQGLTGVYIYDGGATFDTSNSTIGVQQPLLAPIGYGMTNIALVSGGTGYIGAPVVRIAGGSGTGATAVAEIDLAAGSITNIRITSAGSGYLPTDALWITLEGGGALTPAVLGAVGWDTNSALGGLVKIGTGTLMLGGDSTYLGGTIVSNGNLQIGMGTATGSVLGTLTFVNPASTLAFNRTDTITNGYALVTPNGNIASLIQNGRGGTLVLTNAAPQFNTVVVNTGNVLFASTAAIPGAGATITNNVRGAVVVDGAYTTVGGWLASGRIAANSAGALALTGSTAENIDLTGYPALSLGAAPGVAATYLGTLTPGSSAYYLGGGGGQIVLGADNQLVDNGRTNRSLVVGNGGGGIVTILGPNTYNGGTTINNGTLQIEADNALGYGPLALNAAGTMLQITNAPTFASSRLLGIATGGGTVTLDVGAGSTAIWYGVISSAGGGFVYRQGGGTLILSNATFTAASSVFEKNGTTIIDNGAAMYTAASYHNVGHQAGDVATLTIRGTGIFTNNGDFNIADTGGTGTLNVQDSAYMRANNFYVGKAGTGTANLSGGDVYINVNAIIGNAAGSVGTINQTGGTLSVGDLRFAVNATAATTNNLNGGVQTVRGTQLARVWQPTNTGSAVMTMNGGTLRAGNNFVISNLTALSMLGNGGTIDPSNYTVTVNQLISGAGRLTVAGGTGTVFLSGSGTGGLVTNSYTGGTVVNNGVLRFGTTATIGGTGRTVTNNFTGTVALDDAQGPSNLLARLATSSGGTVALVSNTEVIVDLRGNALSNVSVGAIGTVGISGNTITNMGTSYRLGGGWGTLTLSNGIARNVGTNLIAFGSGSGGILRLLGTNVFDNYTVNGGLVQFAQTNAMGSLVTTRPVIVNRGGSVSPTGAVIAAEFLGRIATGSSGTVALIANNAGAVDFNAAGLTALSLGAANGSWTNFGAITPAAGSYRLGGGGGTLVLTNINGLSGANTLMAFGAGSGGALILANTNSYSGGTWIGPTGLVQAATYSLGSGPVTNTGLLVLSQTSSGTLASAISGSGMLIKTNTGTAVLTGANTFTGETVLNSGVLVLGNALGQSVGGKVTVARVAGSSAQVQLWLGANEQIPDTAVLLVTNSAASGDARFDLQGRNETIGGLNGGASAGNVIVEAAIDNLGNSPATLTINTAGGESYLYSGYMRNGAGVTTSPLSLVKSGAGMQTLVGTTVTYNGPTTVNDGILMLSNTTAYASGTTINGGHLLLGTQTAAQLVPITNNAENGLSFGTMTNAYTIGALSGTGDVALLSGMGAVTLTLGNNNQSGTYFGSLTDAGPGNYYMASIVKVGTGTQALFGVSSYRGGTAINGGGLWIQQDSNLGAFQAPVTFNGGTLISTNDLTLNDRPVTLLGSGTFGVGTNATVTVTNAITGPGSLAKNDSGTLLLGTANVYAGSTTVKQGTLLLGAPAALPAATLLVLGDNASSTNVGTLDLNGYSATVGSLATVTGITQAPNSVDTNRILNLAAGQTFNVTTGAVGVVLNVQEGSQLQVVGAGAMTVNDPNGRIYVYGARASNSVTYAGLDLSQLANFSANVSNIVVGYDSSSEGPAQASRQAVMLLAGTNEITAQSFYVGYGPNRDGGVKGLLLLGASNHLNVADFYVGVGKASGAVSFEDGLTAPSLFLRGTTDTARANLYLGKFNPGASGTTPNGYFMVTNAGASVDALLDTAILGSLENTGNSVGSGGYGYLTFNDGTVDVNTLIVGRSLAGSTLGTGLGVLTMNGGDLVVNTAFTLAQRLGSNSNTTGIVNFNGGTATMGVPILGGGGYSTVTLNGGTLNMQGNNIGGTGAGFISNLNFQAGTLIAAGEINGGAGLTKTTAGTLVLQGVNTYTGPTRVMAGVLELTGAASISSSTTLQIDAGAKMVATNRIPTMHLVSGQTLKGEGTFEGGLIADPSSTVSPGIDAPGILSASGNWLLDTGSAFSVQLNGLVAGSEYDQLLFNNNALTLNNPTLNIALGFAPNVWDTFTIVSGLASAASGTFAGLPDGAIVTNNYAGNDYELRINYNDAIGGGDPNNDVTLTVVPEPAAFGLIGLGVAALLFRRRMRG